MKAALSVALFIVVVLVAVAMMFYLLFTHT
jgi:hypothetical protein